MLGRARSILIESVGELAPLSQVGFRNAIQPTCQSVPVVVQAGAASPALLLMHIVTHVLRLTASLRAFSTLPVNSALRLVSLLRTMKSRTAGAARLPKIAAKARVTSNSINVKPVDRLPLETEASIVIFKLSQCRSLRHSR